MPRKLIQSMGYARKGIIYAYRSQRNIRIHTGVGIAAAVLGFLLKISYEEFLIVLLVSSLVIVLEMMNTAMEEIVNLMVLTRKARAMVAKDVAAGAVFIACLFAVVIGLLIFTPRLALLLWKYFI